MADFFPSAVIPAKAGIHDLDAIGGHGNGVAQLGNIVVLDSRLRGNDGEI
jgi:hypothetical protein